jgi:hypothetical protein
MALPACQWLDDSSIFDVQWTSTSHSARFRNCSAFPFVNGFKLGRRVYSHVASESESVTVSFLEQSHAAGLTRRYLNTDILINPVGYFHYPTALLCSFFRALRLRIR